jgi:hypothetical protein
MIPLDPTNYSVGFTKLLSIATRLFSVMIRHLNLTWIQCQEKAKAYLVRKSKHPVGWQMAKNQTRERGYLILGLDNLFREIKKGCITCKAKENEPYNQQMAGLPKYRFEQLLQAFAKTGLDFAGSFHIKKGRAKHRLKSYILVFTCLQTQAVHLEATHNQSISSVLGCR